MTCFGSYDISIKDDYNINKNSCSYLGSNGFYELPQGIEEDSGEAYSYLAGSCYFKVLEMEVFKLEWKK